MNILRALCQNQCRIRRCLINALSDFDCFEQSVRCITSVIKCPAKDTQPWNDPAVQAGDEAKNAIISVIRNCVFCIKMRVMEWVVQLGFEQDLYQVHELAGMYW